MRLRERAAKRGQDPTQYARLLVDKGLASPSLDEILAPIRQEFAESGMTEEERGNLIETAREAVYRENYPPTAR
jgi:hypothetical protein